MPTEPFCPCPPGICKNARNEKERIRKLEAALDDLAGRLEYFKSEGVRPDEWLLDEWAQKARAALKLTEE